MKKAILIFAVLVLSAGINLAGATTILTYRDAKYSLSFLEKILSMTKYGTYSERTEFTPCDNLPKTELDELLLKNFENYSITCSDPCLCGPNRNLYVNENGITVRTQTRAYAVACTKNAKSTYYAIDSNGSRAIDTCAYLAGLEATLPQANDAACRSEVIAQTCDEYKTQKSWKELVSTIYGIFYMLLIIGTLFIATVAINYGVRVAKTRNLKLAWDDLKQNRNAVIKQAIICTISIILILIILGAMSPI